MVKVADIATLRNGYAFRGRIESDPSGDTRVMQAGDLVKNSQLDLGTLACVQLGKKAERYHLTEHDIVFMARGQRQLAYRPISEAVTGTPVITTFGLLVITPDRNKTTADYLHWALNTPQVQQSIRVFAEGTSMSFISEKNFGNVQVPIPTLETQENITRLIDLHGQRDQLREHLAKLDQKLVQTTAWSLATEQPT